MKKQNILKKVSLISTVCFCSILVMGRQTVFSSPKPLPKKTPPQVPHKPISGSILKGDLTSGVEGILNNSSRSKISGSVSIIQSSGDVASKLTKIASEKRPIGGIPLPGLVKSPKKVVVSKPKWKNPPIPPVRTSSLPQNKSDDISTTDVSSTSSDKN